MAPDSAESLDSLLLTVCTDGRAFHDSRRNGVSRLEDFRHEDDPRGAMSENAHELETTPASDVLPAGNEIAPPSLTGAATIHLEAMPVLMYAAAHNGQSPIVRLSVRSSAMSPLHDVSVRATVVDRGTDISAPWERHIEVIGPAGVELHPDVRLRADVVATVEEQRPAQIVIEVSSGDVPLAREARDVVLLAHNQWLVIQGAIPQSLAMLAAFVRPNDPAVTGCWPTPPPCCWHARAQQPWRATSPGPNGSTGSPRPSTTPSSAGRSPTAIHPPAGTSNRCPASP